MNFATMLANSQPVPAPVVQPKKPAKARKPKTSMMYPEPPMTHANHRNNINEWRKLFGSRTLTARSIVSIKTPQGGAATMSPVCAALRRLHAWGYIKMTGALPVEYSCRPVRHYVWVEGK